MDLYGCYCPMGCGETLYAYYGTLSCNHRDCPRPAAADELLSNPETEHIVLFREEDFSVQHPLRERLDGDLFVCELHEELRGLSEAPVPPGRYRVFKGKDGKWGFVKIAEEA